jgi:hypothetical protein
MKRAINVDDLYTAFSPEEGVSPGDVLMSINDRLGRIEHLLALDLVIQHGTPEQQQAARQHLLGELERQAHEQG